MIHAKDIMIGDLVNYRPGWINEETNQVEYESGTGFPVRIEMLYYCHGEGLVQYNDGENDGIEAAEYELFPIPLTPEILEKNGFKVPGYLVWNLKCGAEVQLVPETHDLQNPYMGYRLVVEQKVFGIKDTIICHLKYVHQLQHALKLCEINKEIII